MKRDTRIDDTNLSLRIKNACRQSDIPTVGDLQDLSESTLQGIPRLGKLSREEIIKAGIRKPPLANTKIRLLDRRLRDLEAENTKLKRYLKMMIERHPGETFSEKLLVETYLREIETGW